MPPLDQFESDERSLARLTALGSQHVDPDLRLVARVVARLLTERMCESTEAAFRAGMANAEQATGIAGRFSRAVADEILGQQERAPAASDVAAGRHYGDPNALRI
jgi:hypothetical protein